jgi:hypothetical protein
MLAKASACFLGKWRLAAASDGKALLLNSKMPMDN